MKRITAIALAAILAFSMTACSDNTGEANSTTQETAQTSDNIATNEASDSEKEPVTVEIFQSKVEFVDQLNALITDFEAEYPYITIQADTVGGGQDYSGALKTRMNSGNEPDIFNCGGPTDYATWSDYLEPLTDQPWVQNAYQGTLDLMSNGGDVYGEPYNLEGYGIIYNKDIFEQAGIDPKSINSLSSLENAFATLESKKDELGIETVLSFSIGDSAWWTAAIHNFNIPFAMQEDPQVLVSGLNEGTLKIADNDRFKSYLNLLDLFFKYSYDDLMTMSYDDQVTNFATGKTACLHQGNWTSTMISDINPDINMAFLPIPLSDDPTWKNDSIPVGVPNYWCVNSHSADSEKEAAKLFLNYIASTDRGAKFIVEDSKFIPAFSNITLLPDDQLSASILEYSKEGKTIPWVWPYYPNGMFDPNAKELIQKYYLKEITGDEFLQKLDEAWQQGLEK